MSYPEPDWPDECYEDFFPDPEEEFEDFDCGMDRNGDCGKAGSEECDFECPYRDEQRKAEQRKGRREGE